MSSTRISLAAIAFDAGTQVRATISEQVVSDYAERMREGTDFPPIVLFHDGNRYYIGDGFHRAMATQRVGWKDIAADVEPGTTTDALWFALGANRTNGQRLSEADKTHAVEIALKTWPNKMQREIAEQIGCHPSLVSEVSRKTSGSEPVLRGRALRTQTKRDAVRELVEAGVHSVQIAAQTKVSRSLVSEVRAEMGLARIDKSKAGIQARKEQMREMAESGHTSRQMASVLGLSEEGCRRILRVEGIDVPADRATHNTKHHDSTRIVEHIVMDAQHLTADVGLIEYGDLDASQLLEWLASLKTSRDKLGAFIRRLMEERQKHEAA